MKRKVSLLFLCLLFLGITVHSGYQLLTGWREYRAGKEAYAALSQYMHPAVPFPAPSGPADEHRAEAASPEEAPEEDTGALPTVDFEELQALNPDVVAWIYLEGSEINYPVVQSGDNSYYLYRLVDGGSNSAGSIFMDYRCQPDLSDRHTVLYGHHMKNGSMFASITNYKEQSFYDAHPACLLLTPEGSYRLEFFAGYVAELSGDAWKLEFGSDEEYGAWLERAIADSDFESAVSPAPQDRVVTLSTCSYEYDDARYVLLGVLRKA